MNTVITTTSFKSEDEAKDWLGEQDLECADNYRFAFIDDHEAVNKYEEIQSNGCCGFFDSIIEINGRRAYIGCNYGH